ncbi:Ig-like domain-containing protein [Gemmatimonas sp.]|uniref:Ig-like domain-containing protein n=1 Tax=Gemmatimonas sp. TaxID=1962908 RepID=UPI003F7166C9
MVPLPLRFRWARRSAAPTPRDAAGRLPTKGRRLLLALALTACGGGGDSGPTPPPAPPQVRSVSVTPSSATVRVGETQSLSALVDAAVGAATTVTWTSEAPTLASVNSSGVVTGVGTGTATIRATSTANSAVSGTALIVIQPARSLAVAPTVVNIGTGQTATLTPTLQIDPGLATTVTWRSSAPNVATVSATGVVTGVTQGSTQITVLSTVDTTLRATATVNIIQVVRAVTVTPTAATLNINLTQQLAATVTADAGLATTSSWRSSNPAVASVSNSGLVTALGVGTSTITALATADTNRRATSTITVAPRTTTVTMSQRGVALNPGTSATLTATVVADPGVNTALSWTSSAPQVASVNAQGVVTGLALGSTLITASLTADAARRDTLTVTVVPRLAANWNAARLTGALYEDVVSIVSPAATSTFSVNSVGDVFRWNGTSWASSARGSSFGTIFYAVHAVSPTNVLAVGSNGVIARFDGTTWSAMTSGTTRNLFAVWMESANLAYAAGANGTLLRWNGTAWSSEASGSTLALNALWAGDNVVYAVGNDGTMLRRTTGTWSSVALPTGEDLFGVHGVTASDVVAVGASGTIVRFNGTAWVLVPPAGIAGSFYAVSGSPANGGRRFIAGDGGVAQLDVNTLTAVSTPYAPRLFGITVDGTGGVWATGQRGAVLRSGAPWTTNNLAPDILDVWSPSPTSSFAVGEYGFAWRWDGTTWNRLTTSTTAHLNTVWAVSATDAFAGGENGTMLRWNGTQWLPMAFPSSSSVYAIWGSGAVNVFATTRGGEILRWNGTSWALVQTTSAPLWALFGASPGEIIATGENGAVLRFNGTTFAPIASPAGTGTLSGAWLTGVSNVYAVGGNVSGTAGTASLFNGTSWSSLQVGTTSVLTSIWGPSTNDLYVTGANGSLLRFNGNTWSTIPTGTTDLLWSLSAAPTANGAAFAVGQNGTVVAGTNNALRASVSAATSEATRSFEPGAGAQWRRGALPTGLARQRRR